MELIYEDLFYKTEVSGIETVERDGATLMFKSIFGTYKITLDSEESAKEAFDIVEKLRLSGEKVVIKRA